MSRAATSPVCAIGRRLFIVGGAMAAGLQLAGCDPSAAPDSGEDGMNTAVTDLRLPIEGHLPSLDGATGWLYSEPLTRERLRGKVVLFDFCTYTCINWIRTLPYRRAWEEKYRQHGLVLVAVHTPEFEFEKDVARVRPALAGFGVDYPVALDADYRVWDAFANNYWPALYFVDADGLIRHHFYGEGSYEHLERVIQHLLTRAGRADVPRDLVSVEAKGVEVAADWDNLKSPETYLGYQRGQGFASPGRPRFDQVVDYEVPDRLRLNGWALAGAWTIGSTSAILSSFGGRIALRFHARDMHLVMGPETPGRSVPFRVSLDGRDPGPDHGVDIDERGHGVADALRMYQLVRQRDQVAERQVAIEFLVSGVAAFAFTFG